MNLKKDRVLKEKIKLKLDWASHKAAKFACENWHYSKCIPKSKLVKIGVWENDKFIGVVIFSYGANNNLSRPYALKQTECVELSRIALNKHKTPISRILSISFKFLKKRCPGILLIISYADIDQGHHGGVYQASNWIYAGKTEVGTKSAYIIGSKKYHPKTIYDRFGTRSENVIRKKFPNLKMHVTKGKHKYLFPLNDIIKKDIMKLSKPYPKRATSIDIDAIGFQPIEGGENPTVALHSSETNPCP